MLGKLLKHEFYATFRIFIPIVAMVAVITPISAGMLALTTSGHTAIWAQLLTSLMIFLYVLVMLGFSFSSIVIVLFRFYKSMVSDEAYLTHTLPAKTSAVIVSKLIVSVVLQIATLILFVVSILSFTRIAGAWNAYDFNRFLSSLSELFSAMREINLNGYILILEILLLSLVSVVYAILMMYASIAIGQLLKSHRILGAIGAYIVISIVIQIVMGIFWSFVSIIGVSNAEVVESVESSILQGHFLLLGMSALIAAFSALFFFVTEFIFRKKLNLE